MQAVSASTARHASLVGFFIALVAAAIALVGARPQAGSWNDGSRLAAVEAIVDRHTLAIDDSIFVKVPQPAYLGQPSPYPADDQNLMTFGTRDKLLIQGHYYSDKPAVISLLMAAVYQTWQWLGGTTALQRPDLFCLLMTLTTAGLSYVIAVWCVYRLCCRLEVPLGLALALTGSFALATMAVAYSRHVNNHIMLLAVAGLLFLALTRFAQTLATGRTSWPLLVGIGFWGGLGYVLDLGSGPVLLLCLGGLMLYRCRRLGPAMAFVLGAAPWLLAHHLFNYAIGGTIKPMNTVPEYSEWPGSPFTAANLTGGWMHTWDHFLVYAAALLFGKRGFIGHNLPLFLALPALVALLWRPLPQKPEVVFAGCWCGGTWLMYAAFSNNYSGACISIRWFLPLLVPAYYVLALFLRQWPAYRLGFYVLSAWGVVLAALMWCLGPAWLRLVPWFWPIQVAALVSLIGYRLSANGYRLSAVGQRLSANSYRPTAVDSSQPTGDSRCGWSDERP